MTDPIIIDEAPVFVPRTDRATDFAASLCEEYCRNARAEDRRAFGQFFTPVSVARFMGRFAVSSITERAIRILEPGAGTAILTAAVCEQLPECVEVVHIDGYEINESLADRCEQTLSLVSALLAERGVRCTFVVHRRDFILDTAGTLTSNLFQDVREPYDIAIANPPYFKLSKADPRAQAASHIVHGQPNIYAVFMAIMASLLRPGGSMVSITPRSFTTGEYFRRFREVLFETVIPEAIHLFESRRSAFRGDDILQENVIVHARRRSAREQDHVRVTVSNGVGDLEQAEERVVALRNVVDLTTSQFPLLIPTSDLDEAVLKIVDSWAENFAALGLRVSTGPVVAFRATEFLRDGDTSGGDHLAPLLWLQNIRSMRVTWPLVRPKKNQYIVDSVDSAYLLLPNQPYVVMRRFSTKEEQRRLVAAPLLEGQLPGRMIGLENHLNYIHRPAQGLRRYETIGLSALLCSALVDRYFRISNGNTQVSAVELRQLPLPSAQIIEAIGQAVEERGGTGLDQTVHDALHVPAPVRRELEQDANVEGG